MPLNDTILSLSLFRSDKIAPDNKDIDQFGLSPIHEVGSYLRLDLSMQMEENHTLIIDCLRDLSTAPIFQRKGLQMEEGKFIL